MSQEHNDILRKSIGSRLAALNRDGGFAHEHKPQKLGDVGIYTSAVLRYCRRKAKQLQLHRYNAEFFYTKTCFIFPTSIVV